MDIFISYAHIDNEPLIEDYPGWVTAFHQVLEKRLRQLLGEAPAIWRDLELRGNDYFDDEIAERFRGARLFVSVVSPRYVKSDYCQKELREFLEAAAREGGVRVGNRSRVIKVIKTPVNLAEQPESIRPMLGYAFFREDPESKKTRELAAYPPTFRDQFLLVLDDLAQEISDTLEEVRAGGNGGPAPAAPAAEGEAPRPAPAEDAPVVYLATTTGDVQEARDRIRRALVEAGALVLPEQNLPLEIGAFEEAVREDLARSRVAVHLVGARHAFSPEGADLSSVEIQLRLSAERSAEGGGTLRRLIWMPPDLEPEDPRQAGFVERLKEDPEAQANAQLLATRLEVLEAELEEALRPPRREPEPEAPPATGAAGDLTESGPVRLYLIHDPRDAEAVAPLEDLLWELEDEAGEKRFEVFTRLLEGSEAEVREDHEDNLRQCDAFLVYHGHGNERWLRQQLSELRKARGLREGRPVRAQAVFLAPPESPAKARFRSNEVLVLGDPEGPEPAAGALDPFLEALASSGS